MKNDCKMTVVYMKVAKKESEHSLRYPEDNLYVEIYIR